MKCELLQNLLSSIEHLYQDCVISFAAIWSRYFGYPVHCVYIAIPSNTCCLSACTPQKCAWSRELLCAKCPTNLTADHQSVRYKTPTNFHGTEPSLIGRWHCDDALNVYQYVNIVSKFCYDMTIIYIVWILDLDMPLSRQWLEPDNKTTTDPKLQTRTPKCRVQLTKPGYRTMVIP